MIIEMKDLNAGDVERLKRFVTENREVIDATLDRRTNTPAVQRTDEERARIVQQDPHLRKLAGLEAVVSDK